MKTGTHDRGTTFFPLYRYESYLGGKVVKTNNLTSQFVQEWCEVTGTEFVETGSGNGESTTGPEDVFLWLYALCHSLEYRRRYRAALAQRFPIVMLTSNAELRRSLVRLGRELVSLHLMESPRLDESMTEFVGANREVRKIGYSTHYVWINAGGTKAKPKPGTSGFRGVPEEVWNFHIGGYPVCEKWLKDRKGRTLSDDDVAHYQKIVVALSETIRLMAEIDRVIDEHGGWPGAFVTERLEAAAAAGDGHGEAEAVSSGSSSKPSPRS
jgi:predicted helicase